MRNICGISFIAKNYRKKQFVGNSDELPLTGKIILQNTIIWMLSFFD